MTVTFDLNPEMERELRQEAARAGLTETALLETISAAWPAETQARFDALVTKRRARKITPVELAELNSLTDQSEILTAERVRAVGDLARLRVLTFDETWFRLGG